MLGPLRSATATHFQELTVLSPPVVGHLPRKNIGVEAAPAAAATTAAAAVMLLDAVVRHHVLRRAGHRLKLGRP